MRQVIRGSAMGLGLLIGLNLVGRWSGGLDGNDWWIDWYRTPASGVTCIMIVSAMVLIGWAVRPVMGLTRRRFSVMWMLLLAGVCAINAANVMRLQWGGRIGEGGGLPMSAMMGAMLMGIAWMMRNDKPGRGAPRGAAWRMGAGLTLFLTLFALGQMWCFGRTDYRRPADAIVVFGARVYSDGRLSAPLSDRVRTAAELYRQGYAPLVIMSGGPGGGAIHETQAMRDYAARLGVPVDRIVLDRAGLSTRDTVRQTVRLFDELHVRRVLAVSNAYHLPRVKLAFRQAGVGVFTVPAKERYTLRKMPYYVAREVAAWWCYYVGGLVSGGIESDGIKSQAGRRMFNVQCAMGEIDMGHGTSDIE